jgi:starch phosphorylase
LRFGEVKAETKDNQHWFEAQVYLGEIALDAVRVELYADGAKGEHAVRREMDRARPIVGAVNGCIYTACVPATRSASGYTARIVPHHDGVAVPLEAVRILWQR